MNHPKIDNRLGQFITLGINRITGIGINDSEVLNRYIIREVESIREEFRDRLSPGFDYSRRLYRLAGVDPTRYRPSSEALWRRVKRGLPLPDITDIVNLTNMLSLKFQIPFGLYDGDRVSGMPVLRIGNPGDGYEGIGKARVNLEGKIVLSDDRGSFGNPSSDSLRTAVSPDSKNILQVLFFLREDPRAGELLEEAADHIRKYFKFIDLISTMC